MAIIGGLSPGTPTPNNSNDYEQLERDRRLRLGQIICIASMVVLILSVPLLLVRYHFSPDAVTLEFKILNFVFIALAFAFFVGCYILIQRRQMGLALVLIILTPLLAATGYQSIALIQFGMTGIISSVFGAYLIMIAFAGILGDARLILSSLALAIAITLGLCLLLPQPNFDLGRSLTLCFSLFIQQFVMALVTLSANVTIHHIISQLSTTRDAYERELLLNQLKDQFISNVNHELRNAFFVLFNILEVTERRAATMQREEIIAEVSKATQSGQTIRAQLTAILDTRQLDLSSLDFRSEVVVVADALTRSLEMFDPRKPSAGAHPLTITIPEGVLIWGESVRLQQVFMNLLANASKYSDADTPIDVSASRHEASMVEITVRDRGLGIPPDQQGMLFNSFARLTRDIHSPVKGNGLGLYLCRMFVKAMGGKIWIESTGVAGEGTTFHLMLPMPTAEQMALETMAAKR